MKIFLSSACAFLVVTALAAGVLRTLSAAPPNFDRLSAADRKVFAERFEREIWPLLTRGSPRSSCVGCHNGKIVSALTFSGDPKKDFPKLLREGFFLHDDAGSLLSRIIDKDPERRMPKDRKPWAEKDIEVLRSFYVDLDKKQKR